MEFTCNSKHIISYHVYIYIYITLYYFILITYTMSINIPSKNMQQNIAVLSHGIGFEQFLQRQKTSRAGRVVWLRCHPVYMAARATGDRQQAAFDITHPKNWETSRFPSVIVIELLSPVAWEGDVPWIFHLWWFKNRSRGNYAIVNKFMDICQNKHLRSAQRI